MIYLISHFSLSDPNFSSTVMWLVCTFSDSFCIFGFPDEFANVVTNLSRVSFGEV